MAAFQKRMLNCALGIFISGVNQLPVACYQLPVAGCG